MSCTRVSIVQRCSLACRWSDGNICTRSSPSSFYSTSRSLTRASPARKKKKEKAYQRERLESRAAGYVERAAPGHTREEKRKEENSARCFCPCDFINRFCVFKFFFLFLFKLKRGTVFSARASVSRIGGRRVRAGAFLKGVKMNG